MSEILRVENLSKNYLTKRALTNVSFTLNSGRILGLMGPNGSGKTTLLKILAGLLQPSGGNATVCNTPIGTESKKIVSFLPDRNVMYPTMKVKDAIGFYADFFADFDRTKAYDMLQDMKLDANETVKTMSKGMVEKMNLMLTFSRNAKLYILDEPLGGVDPVARERIISTIIKTYSEDSSIIISTHLVNDVESIFDDVCFIGKGEIILQGSADELRSTRGKSIDQIYVDLFADE
ncbi:MAG: ABC transporter ATP-binding protein [Spirochaetaceae bacterium]|nr:ABC transporter ATP-binding protein [Spirochaetaceae bacterium]